MKNVAIRMLALLCLFTSSSSFAYDSYDYSPVDEPYYDQEEVDYNFDHEYEEPRYKRPQHVAESSRSNFTGAGKVFVFDPKVLRWFAYYNGELINSGRASGGKHYCPDIRRGCKTPVGVFRITSKGGPDCRSSKYPIGRGNAPMPWCMFFHRGYAIHGGPVPSFNASHGCIRVLPPDARWLSNSFLSHGTKVIVKSYW